MALELSAQKTALLVYDMDDQLEHEAGIMEALPEFSRLLDHCRQAGVLAFFAIGKYAAEAGRTVAPSLAPAAGERLYAHPGSGVFYNTDCEAYLRDQGRDTVVIAGLAVDRGANTSARQAMNRDFRTLLVRGLCFTRDIAESPFGRVSREDLERTHLAALHRIGATIVRSDEVIAALPRS